MERQGLAFERSPIFLASLFSGKSEHKSDSCCLIPGFPASNRLNTSRLPIYSSKSEKILAPGINRRLPGISRANGSHITACGGHNINHQSEDQMKRIQNLVLLLVVLFAGLSLTAINANAQNSNMSGDQMKSSSMMNSNMNSNRMMRRHRMHRRHRRMMHKHNMMMKKDSMQKPDMMKDDGMKSPDMMKKNQ